MTYTIVAQEKPAAKRREVEIPDGTANARARNMLGLAPLTGDFYSKYLPKVKDEFSEEKNAGILIAYLHDLDPMAEGDDHKLVAVNQVLRRLIAIQFTEPTYRHRVRDKLKSLTGWNEGRLNEQIKGVKHQLTETRKAHGIVVGFRHRGPDDQPLDHTDNVQRVLEDSQLLVRLNLMSHKVEVFKTHPAGKQFVPQLLPMPENERNNLQITLIKNLCVEHQVPINRTMEHVTALACADAYHPFLEYLDRDLKIENFHDAEGLGEMIVQQVFATAGINLDSTQGTLALRWFVSIVHAALRDADDPRPPPRGVLTFTGPQLVGKTSWFKKIVPPGMFLEGHSLNPDNKDSVKVALGYLVVELGELDATFKKADLSKLKAFLSKGKDELRQPYAPSESVWLRQTVFCGTVNDPEFLHDLTGNSRYWTIPTPAFNLDELDSIMSGSGRRVFWREITRLYLSGYSWLLTRGEAEDLEKTNKEHLETGPMVEIVMEHFDFELPPDTWVLTPLTRIGQIMGRDLAGHGSTKEGRDLINAIKYCTGQQKSSKEHYYRTDGGRTTRRGWYMPPQSPHGVIHP